jgi:hypothetical protein
MNEMKRSCLGIAILIVLLSPALLAQADEPLPVDDYIVDVGDGRFVLVMLAADSAVIDGIQDKGIRAKYAKSGLYEMGDTGQAIWTVDWYALEVDSTPDGKHLVRWGPWPSIEGYDELALAFYENGVLLRSYPVRDLVAEPQKLPRTASHLAWKAESEFNAENGELYVRTENDEEYLFDVTTGDPIEKRRPINAPPCTPIGLILVLGTVGVSFLGKRTRPS